MNCGAKSDEAEMKIEVGSFVVVDKDKKGKVMYSGEDKNTKEFFGPGLIYGVMLSEKRGTMNGTYKNEKFFRCQDGHGVMVKAARITKVLADSEVDFNFDEWEKVLAAEAAKEAKIAAAKKAATKMKGIFKKIDTDGNYLIEKDEFVKAMGESNVCEADAKAMFVAIDLTKSGSLSMAEFKGFLAKMEKEADEGKDLGTAKYVELLTKE